MQQGLGSDIGTPNFFKYKQCKNESSDKDFPL